MSVTVRHHRPMAAAILASAICLAPAAASAQSRLPWADANPLETLVGKPGGQRPPAARRATAAKAMPAVPAVPAIAGVPVPEARPQQRSAAYGPSRPAGAAAVATPGADDALDQATSGVATGDAVAATPTKAPAGPEREAQDAAAKNASAPRTEAPPIPAADPASPPVDPAKTAEKPIAEIPVPAVRPADAPSDPASSAIDTGAAADAPASVPGTKVQNEAPNAVEKLKARATDISPATAVIAAAAIEDAELCEAELKKRGAEFTVGNSISEGDCGVLRPVNVTRLSSGVRVSPDTLFLCRTALALDDWMTGTVVPAARTELASTGLTEFRHASTYVCRPRASENGISEHARGSAIDIAAFVFDGRPEIGIEAHAAGTPEAKFQDAVRRGACGPFKTVLGPGTDADHATHFHLDIAARSNGSTYCR